MTGISSCYAFSSFLCILIALFYLLRLATGRRWLRHFDAENEVGHGMMAIGMLVMLQPVGTLSPSLLLWNVILFAAASLWWTLRLLVRKPLLVFLLGQSGAATTVQSDALHVLMHGGMCYMFLLMSSMLLSMTRPAFYATCLFCISFILLTLFYGREIRDDFRVPKTDWPQLGANLAHIFMSGMMCWMFFSMISMNMSMGIY